VKRLTKLEIMIAICKKNINLVYLVMSRQLERLIERHKRGIARKQYGRNFGENISSIKDKYEHKHGKSLHHYSISLENAEKIEELEDEFLDLGDNSKNVTDDDSEQVLKSSEEKASQILISRSSHKLLSKLFSNVNEITCSNKLSGKLISYYLRNRRKHRRISRSYSQKLSYIRNHSNVSLDNILHEMYIELGRTLYFSFLGKVRDKIKYAVFKFMEVAADLIIGLIGAGFWGLSFYQAFKSATSTFVKFLLKLLGVTTPAGKLFAAVVLGILAGVGLFFAMRGLGNLIVGKDEEALEVFDKGRKIYKKIKRALRKGLPDALGTKGIIALALQVSKDKIDKGKIENKIKALESLDKKTTELVNHKFEPNESSFLESIKENADIVVSVIALIRDDLKVTVASKSGQEITIPDKIALRPFEVSIDNNESRSQADDGKRLPPEIMAIALITSPEIQIDIEAGDSKLNIQFNANKYFAKYAGFEQGEIKDFVVSYLKIYDHNEVRERLKELSNNIGGGLSGS